jgi:hypothetical protein
MVDSFIVGTEISCGGEGRIVDREIFNLFMPARSMIPRCQDQ